MPPVFLRFGDHLEGDRRLTGGFRAVNLADSSARKTAGPQGRIERDGAGRNHRYRDNGILRAEPQDRTLSKLLLDLAERLFQRACAFFFVHEIQSSCFRPAQSCEQKAKIMF